MQLSLYKFQDKPTVANKLNSLSPVFSGDITPYGSFNARSASFVLSSLYDINYAKYTFNDRDYYGTCTPAARSDGLYIYYITVDPLTTAWYGNCMNTSARCLYSASGNSDIADTRLEFEKSLTSNQYVIGTATDSGYWTQYYVMTVLSAFIDTAPPVNPPFAETTRTYVFTRDAFKNFLLVGLPNIPSESREAYMQSILSVYCVSQDEFYTNTQMNNQYTTTTDIVLNKAYESIHVGITEGTVWKINGLRTASTTPQAIYRKKTVDITYYPELNTAAFYLYIRDMGVINFHFSDIVNYLTDNKITSIGYELAYNFVSGTQTAYLIINNVTLHHISAQANIPEQIPLSSPSHITNWFRLLSGTMAGNSTGVVSSCVNLATGMSLIAPFKNEQFEIAASGSTRVGSIGGTTDRFARIGSFVVMQYFAPIDKANYQALYGKPDGNVKNLSTLSGYVQTDKCLLVSNGYENDIIKDAQSACDCGIYIR